MHLEEFSFVRQLSTTQLDFFKRLSMRRETWQRLRNG
jgi:hypothetical protein